MTKFIKAGLVYFNIDYIKYIVIKQINVGYTIAVDYKGKEYNIAFFDSEKECEIFTRYLFEHWIEENGCFVDLQDAIDAYNNFDYFNKFFNKDDA